MGIPKFFRWISERYPMLNRPIPGNIMPEFDNLYLDMNGIIHNCTHPNDADPLKQTLTQQEMMLNVFKYLDKLFDMIRPRKLLYMAIDGVAPRAKMNQQRARRFRSARDTQEALEQAASRGKAPPAGPMFDSNCITPGTGFMHELTKHIKFYIHYKIHTDPSWRNVNVIFSGHEIPGEGEHKIMEYIRYRKSLPDWPANETHCMYGLDADLIMLGLVTHEPHFSLLREDVLNRRKGQPDQFHLLHLGLLREYLDLEFECLRLRLPFGYDLEKIIDDFVFMCYFVGNDFLPHLPYLDIADNALNRMFDIYKELLPSLGGYLTDCGTIHLARVEHFIQQLSQIEKEILDELEQELQARDRSRRGGRGRNGNGRGTHDDHSQQHRHQQQPSPSPIAVRHASKSTDQDADDLDVDNELEDDGAAANGRSGKQKRHSSRNQYQAIANPDDEEVDGGIDDDDDGAGDSILASAILPRDLQVFEINPEDIDEDDGVALEALEPLIPTADERQSSDWKNRYYLQKFGHSLDDVDFHRQLRRSYIEGLAWVLKYYYDGCVSWGWFFPFHYAPLASDLVGIADMQIEFVLGKPFFPYQQLLGVLPIASKDCLPVPYQELMLDPKSPLAGWYPLDFKIDMNGKKNSWEGVVLVPFIDEKALLAASESIDPARLTPEERARNEFGHHYLFRFNPKVTIDVYPSSIPSMFDSLRSCNVSCTIFEYDPKVELRHFQLCQDARMGADSPPRFPTFATLEHYALVKLVGVALFGFGSKRDSLLVCLKDREHQLVTEYALEPNVVTPGASPAAASASSSSSATKHTKHNNRHGRRHRNELDDDENVDDGDDHDGEAGHIDTRALTDPGVVRVRARQLVDLVLQKRVYIDWPYHHEALVEAILTQSCEYTGSASEPRALELSAGDLPRWRKLVTDLESQYRIKKALDMGPISIVLRVRRMIGVKRLRDGSVEPVYQAVGELYPFNAVVLSLANADPRYSPATLAGSSGSSLPVGSTVVIKIKQFYGCLGVITRSGQKLKVQIDTATQLQPDLSDIISAHYATAEQYFPMHVVAGRLHLAPRVLARITASFRVNNRDIGLKLKFSKTDKQVLGYTQRLENAKWTFSEKAIELVRQYMLAFPDLFQAISNPRLPDDDIKAADLFREKPEARLHEITDWLARINRSDMPLVPCGTVALSAATIDLITQRVANFYAQPPRTAPAAATATTATAASPSAAAPAVVNVAKKVSRLIDPDQVFMPVTNEFVQLSPSGPTEQQHPVSLGDRVRYLRSEGPAPFGSIGTVIGSGPTGLMIVFDTQFVSGTTLGGRCPNLRGLADVARSHVVNLSTRAAPQRTKQRSPIAAGSPNRSPYPSHRGGKATGGVEPFSGAARRLSDRDASGAASGRGSSRGRGRGGHPSSPDDGRHVLLTPSAVQAAPTKRTPKSRAQAVPTATATATGAPGTADAKPPRRSQAPREPRAPKNSDNRGGRGGGGGGAGRKPASATSAAAAVPVASGPTSTTSTATTAGGSSDQPYLTWQQVQMMQQ